MNYQASAPVNNEPVKRPCVAADMEETAKALTELELQLFSIKSVVTGNDGADRPVDPPITCLASNAVINKDLALRCLSLTVEIRDALTL